MSVTDTTFYVGPVEIDQDLIDDVKSGKSVNLPIPATSFSDVLDFFESALGATTGKDSEVWRLEHVLLRTRVTSGMVQYHTADLTWLYDTTDSWQT